MHAPFISVVIPAYNRQDLLPATLESVLAQRFDDYEIVVIDDASTDGTAEVARRYGSRVRVVVCEQNRGLPAARNVGIQHSRGRYVALLDSDDLWFPWTLEAYVQAIRRFDGPAFVSSDGVGFADRQSLGRVTEAPFEAGRFNDYLSYEVNGSQGWLIPSGVAFQTDVARAVGGFCETFRYFEDNDMWLRLGTAPGFVRIRKPICWGYREHAANMTKDFSRQLTGMSQLLAQERGGQYPGDAPRRRDRLEVITARARHIARKAAERGFVRSGMNLYHNTLGWNLECRRWKFVLGYPLECALSPVLHRTAQRRESATEATVGNAR